MIKSSFERKELLTKELKRIVEILIQEYFPDQIILWGSLAKGNLHAESDIDLMIIKDTSKRFIQRLHEVRRLTRPEVDVDFIVYTPAEIKEMQLQGRHFLTKEIFNILYER